MAQEAIVVHRYFGFKALVDHTGSNTNMDRIDSFVRGHLSVRMNGMAQMLNCRGGKNFVNQKKGRLNFFYQKYGGSIGINDALLGRNVSCSSHRLQFTLLIKLQYL
jgi:hypothetical protein